MERAAVVFLSPLDPARLRGPNQHDHEGRDQQADIVRILLLTGCHGSEIVNLRWSEVRNCMMALSDAKTRPRKIPLSSRAKAVLD